MSTAVDDERPPSEGQSIGPRRLLELVESIYKSFNPAQVTLDTHVDNCLGDGALTNSLDEVFVRQVVYGIVRYRSFLGCIMDSFYHYNGGTALREDMDMYKIFGYLTCFRLKELGHVNLKRLVDAKEPQKMVVLFRYLLDPQHLHHALRDDWLKLYDKQFVDRIVCDLEGATPDMSAMLEALDSKVYFTRRRGDEGGSGSGGDDAPGPGPGSTSINTDKRQPGYNNTMTGHGGSSNPSSSRKGSPSAAAGPGGPAAAGGAGAGASTTTVPQPFNLSQPRPKPSQIDLPPPPPIKSRPAPPRCDGPTKEEVALHAAKEANRRRAEALLATASPFKLRVLERPTNLSTIRAEIESDIERQLTFKPVVAKPPPPPPNAQVRLNAAAILREDAQYRRRQADEAAALQKYEAELRDASTFKSWQAEQLSKDEAARQAAVEARRLEMAAVQDAAARAKAAQIAANLELGKQLKEEAKAIAAALEADKEEERRQKAAKRAEVVEGRAAVGAAVEKLVSDKRSVAEEERQRQAAHAKALMEAQLREAAEKRDIVLQLRALETVQRKAGGVFDPTTTPDHGLLESMSLVELRERLAVAKQQAKDEEERRRTANMQSRQEREAMLMAKAQNIQAIRKIAAVQAAQRRDAATKETTAKAVIVKATRELSVLQLTDKLEEKRAAGAAEKARIAAETKRIRFEQQQQAAGASEVEATKFRELRSGAAREAATRQVTRLEQQTLNERTRVKAQTVRMNEVKSQQKAKEDFLKMYDERIAAATQQFKKETTQTMQQKQQQAAACHAAETDAFERTRSRWQAGNGSQSTAAAVALT